MIESRFMNEKFESNVLNVLSWRRFTFTQTLTTIVAPCCCVKCLLSCLCLTHEINPHFIHHNILWLNDSDIILFPTKGSPLLTQFLVSSAEWCCVLIFLAKSIILQQQLNQTHFIDFSDSFPCRYDLFHLLFFYHKLATLCWTLNLPWIKLS